MNRELALLVDTLRRIPTRWVVAGCTATILITLILSSLYVVDQTEWVWLSARGPGAGQVILVPGIHLKWPWQGIRRFTTKWQSRDITIEDQPVRDGDVVSGMACVTWRPDPSAAALRRRASLPENDAALAQRVQACVGNELQAEISRRSLAEVLGKSPDETPAIMEAGVSALVCARCRDILLSRYGVELVELNIVRLGVAGAAQARLFRGTVATKGLETARILYQANLEAGKIHEQADAEATRMQVEAIEQAAAIQADALIEADRIVRPVEARDPELAGLVRAVNSYRAAMDADTTLILEGGNEFFRLLERRPEGSAQKSAAPSTRPTTQSTRPTTQTTRP